MESHNALADSIDIEDFILFSCILFSCFSLFIGFGNWGNTIA